MKMQAAPKVAALNSLSIYLYCSAARISLSSSLTSVYQSSVSWGLTVRQQPVIRFHKQTHRVTYFHLPPSLFPDMSKHMWLITKNGMRDDPMLVRLRSRRATFYSRPPPPHPTPPHGLQTPPGLYPVLRVAAAAPRV